VTILNWTRSGNVFRDLDQPNADLQQLRAILAAEIIGAMDARKLSTRKAEAINRPACS